MPLPRPSRCLALAPIIALPLLLSACGTVHPERRSTLSKRSHREVYNEAYHHVLAGRYCIAITGLQPLAESSNPANTYRDDALFWMGYCHLERGEAYAAAKRFQQLQALFPSSPYVDMAHEQLELIGHTKAREIR